MPRFRAPSILVVILTGLIAVAFAVMMQFAIAYDVATNAPAISGERIPRMSHGDGSAWYFRRRDGNRLTRIDATATNARVSAGQFESQSAAPLPPDSVFQTRPANEDIGIRRSECLVGWPLPALRSLIEYPIDGNAATRYTIVVGRDVTPTTPAPAPVRRGRLGNAQSTNRNAHYVMSTSPIWPGFAVNVSVVGGVIWVAFIAFWCVFVIGPLSPHTLLRRISGQCINCGYRIRANNGVGIPGCPECGLGRATGPGSEENSARPPR